MSESDNPNPYRPPAESELPQKSEQPKSTWANVVWLFVVPFSLAHVVYWPVFLIGLDVFDSRGDYGATGFVMGTVAALVAGAAYGLWLGLKVQAENSSTPSLHPAAYALGQSLWFLFSLLAPCSFLLVAGGM